MIIDMQAKRLRCKRKSDESDNNYNYDEKINWTDKQRYFCNKLSQLRSIKIAIDRR